MNDEKTLDLLHDLIIQLELNDTYQSLDDKKKLFFFIRSFKNQYFSNSSYFYRDYKKNITEEIKDDYHIYDEEYQEKPTMEWVIQTLDTEVAINPSFWYNAGLFKLYIEHRKIDTVHKKTTIPKYSVRATIKEMKIWLNKKWMEYKDGQDKIR
jgi:hypothetical protein